MGKRLKKLMKQRGKRYPISLSAQAISQGKRLGINIKTLLKMTERVAYYGIWDWDAATGTKADKYFTKLINAFDKHILFKLSSDYVFAFDLTELAAIFPIHESVRGEAQDLFIQNKREWDSLNTQQRETRKGDNLKELSQGNSNQVSIPKEVPLTQREIWDAEDIEDEKRACREFGFGAVGSMTDEEWVRYNAEFSGL